MGTQAKRTHLLMDSFSPGIMDGFTLWKNPLMEWFLKLAPSFLSSSVVQCSQLPLLVLEKLQAESKRAKKNERLGSAGEERRKERDGSSRSRGEKVSGEERGRSPPIARPLSRNERNVPHIW